MLVPANARKRRLELIRRWNSIENYLSHDFKFNRVEGEGDKAIIASGLAYAYVREIVDRYNLRVKVLKISSPVPLPSKFIVDAISDCSKVLVVEELEPVVEIQLRSLLNKMGLNIEVHGKNYVGLEYELTFERVASAISKFLDLSLPMPEPIDISDIENELPQRPPVLCPGCPYRPLFYVLRRIANRFRGEKGYEPIFTGDIGCYTLGLNPPYRVQDTCIEMGGSIGVANGFAQVLDVPVIAIIGDSTFYHAGLPPLLNAVYNKAPFLTIVLDNGITAMTGHQPHPGTGLRADGTPARKIRLEDVIRGLGVEVVEIVDPFDIDKCEKVIDKVLNYVMEQKKPAVVISRRSCALVAISRARRAGFQIPRFKVLSERCRACGICYRLFACPAIVPAADGKAQIDPALCTGCGVCVAICPFKAIVATEEIDWSKWSEFWRC